MGHLVLHDAHLPGPGQPGKVLEEGGSPGREGREALGPSHHLLVLVIKALPFVPTLLSCQHTLYPLGGLHNHPQT